MHINKREELLKKREALKEKIKFIEEIKFIKDIIDKLPEINYKIHIESDLSQWIFDKLPVTDNWFPTIKWEYADKSITKHYFETAKEKEIFKNSLNLLSDENDILYIAWEGTPTIMECRALFLINYADIFIEEASGPYWVFDESRSFCLQNNFENEIGFIRFK